MDNWTQEALTHRLGLRFCLGTSLLTLGTILFSALYGYLTDWKGRSKPE